MASLTNSTWASGRERRSAVSNQVSFSVTQNAQELVSELEDPSSEASQAVVTSFRNALQLPVHAELVVLSAQLQRRLGESVSQRRKLQGQSIALEIEISGLSADDADIVANSITSEVATDALGAHLEENLGHLESIDVGDVGSVTVIAATSHQPPVTFYRYVTRDPADESGEMIDYTIAGGAVFVALTVAFVGFFYIYLARKKRYAGKSEDEKEDLTQSASEVEIDNDVVIRI